MLPLMIETSVVTYYNTLMTSVSRFPHVSTYVLLIGGAFLMTESVRFLGRQTRLQSSPVGAVGKVDPLALTAMQQTGTMVPQQAGRGSQRFLQGGLSAPIPVTWEITAACNIACVHCLSSSGRRRPRELTTQQSLALVELRS